MFYIEFQFCTHCTDKIGYDYCRILYQNNVVISCIFQSLFFHIIRIIVRILEKCFKQYFGFIEIKKNTKFIL